MLEVMERREQLDSERAGEQAAIDGMESDLAAVGGPGTRLWSRSNRLVPKRLPAVPTWPQVRPRIWLRSGERQRGKLGLGAGRLQAGAAVHACRIELDRGELARIAAAPEDEVLRCPECQAILVRVTGS